MKIYIVVGSMFMEPDFEFGYFTKEEDAQQVKRELIESKKYTGYDSIDVDEIEVLNSAEEWRRTQ